MNADGTTTDEVEDDEPSLQPFAQNQVAAALPASPDDALTERLRAIGVDSEMDVYCGQAGVDALSPDNFLERVRMSVSEDARAIETLTEAIADGEFVVVLSGIDDEEKARQATSELVDAGAGWVYHFDDLSWVELHSPMNR